MKFIMKKTILIFAVSCALASCGNNDTKQAELQQADKTADSLKMEMAKKATIDSMNAVIAAQQGGAAQATPAGNEVIEHHTTEYTHHEHDRDGNKETTTRNDQATVTNPNTSTNVNTTSTTTTTSAPNTPPTTVTNTTSTATTTANQKPGWSAKAKGAVIGAGAGAITGALLDSKKKGQAVKGGVIGGVLGAAAGLGAGAIIDKKNKDKNTDDANK
jgi:hypothetical protein